MVPSRAPGDAARAPVRIEADLSIEVDGAPVDVFDRNGSLVVETDSFRTARKVLDGVRALPVGTDGASLAAAGVAVEVRVRHATVARLGAGVEPGRLSPLLGRLPGDPVDGAAIDLAGVLTALARRFY